MTEQTEEAIEWVSNMIFQRENNATYTLDLRDCRHLRTLLDAATKATALQAEVVELGRMRANIIELAQVAPGSNHHARKAEALEAILRHAHTKG